MKCEYMKTTNRDILFINDNILSNVVTRTHTHTFCVCFHSSIEVAFICRNPGNYYWYHSIWKFMCSTFVSFYLFISSFKNFSPLPLPLPLHRSMIFFFHLQTIKKCCCCYCKNQTKHKEKWRNGMNRKKKEFHFGSAIKYHHRYHFKVEWLLRHCERFAGFS